jgi:ABC-type branched-subunit amino acid transport system ATPase component
VTASGSPLALRDVTVRFGGVHALEDIALDVRPAEVHGLVGPNGSGKTTILNAICGFVAAKGEITLAGERIDGLAVHGRMARGLGRTFQNPRPVRELTVRDLMRIGEHQRGTQPWWQVALMPWAADRAQRATNDRAVRLLGTLGLPDALLDEQLVNLPSGVLKMVDIARALMGTPRVLLLDEPTSGMNEAEIALLHAALADLRTGAMTIVLVEHNLRFMFDICDAMTVLDTGRVIGAGTPDEVFQRDDVIRAYLGTVEAPTAAAPRHTPVELGSGPPSA